MNDTKLAELVKAGKIIAVGEFRSGTTQPLAGVGKGGRAWKMNIANHHLEIAGVPGEFSERLADDAKLEDYKFPAKGTIVLVEFTPEAAEAGKYRITVKLHAMVAKAA